MTVSVQPTGEDDFVKEAIDQIFTSPLQTLDELQNSFITQPKVSVKPGSDSVELESSQLRAETTSILLSETSFPIATNDEPCIDEIRLEDDESFRSVPLYGGRSIPLAKVGNYVDADTIAIKDGDNNFEALQSDCCLPDAGHISNEDTVAERRQRHTSQLFEVIAINTVHEDDPFPGEVEQKKSPPRAPKMNTENMESTDNASKIEANYDTHVAIAQNVTDCYGDDIVEFKLDENFDYDHARHTPKFTVFNMDGVTGD